MGAAGARQFWLESLSCWLGLCFHLKARWWLETPSPIWHTHTYLRSGWLLAGGLRSSPNGPPRALLEHPHEAWHLAFPKQVIRERHVGGLSITCEVSEKAGTLTSLVSYHYKDQSLLFGVGENPEFQEARLIRGPSGRLATRPSFHLPLRCPSPLPWGSILDEPSAWRLCFRLCFGESQTRTQPKENQGVSANDSHIQQSLSS